MIRAFCALTNGIHTAVQTAATLTFAVYLLSTHPEVFARLRTEVLEKVGPSQRPSYDNIRDMKFLRAVINETLRLFPPV